MLQSGGGGPIPPSPPTGGRGARRAGIIAGAGILGVGVLAAGAWAGYSAFFATGDQAAQALPDSTVGYVSVDLDPSGQQKLEALKTLSKFPGFSDNVDVSADDDLRLRFFESIQGDGTCADLDFAEDLDPWVGNRFAAAAIDLGDGAGAGGAAVTPVAVVQVDDASGAEDGLAALKACGGDDGSFGWSVAGDWAVIAETTEIAEQVTDAAAKASLSDDEEFQRWTGETGDSGILTAYAAPEAGKLLIDSFSDLGALTGVFGGGSTFACSAVPVDPTDPFGDDPFGDDPFATDSSGEDSATGDTCDDSDTLPAPEAEQLTATFADFEGAAVTIRFADGGLEVETASGSGSDGGIGTGDGGDDVVATLPESTAIAFGVGFDAGWFDQISGFAGGVLGEGGLEEMLDGAEAETGLQLPEDIETLLGESAAVALDGNVDMTAFESPEPPSDLALGVKIKGDTPAISDILDTLFNSSELAGMEENLGYDSNDDYVAGGFSADYRATLLEDGGLGDTDAFKDVVISSEKAGSLLFVNFDAGTWLSGLDGVPAEVQDNLAPLKALGLSGWSEDGVNHVALRVSTE